MTHTKKRILAMLLAVVLMFSSLPFSVSADEITISGSSGDVPVLYAQDPFNTVKSEVEGGTNYMTSVGVTREAIVRSWKATRTMISTWVPNMWAGTLNPPTEIRATTAAPWE